MINDTKDPKQQTAGGRELKNAADAAGNLKQAVPGRRDPHQTAGGRELKNAADAAGNLKQAASDRRDPHQTAGGRDPQRTKAGGHDPHVMGILCMLAASVLFSTGGLFVKIIPWSPLTINGVRNLIACAVIGVYLIIIRHRLRFNLTILAGAVSFAGVTTLYTVANKLTTAGNTIILQYTAPVWIIILMFLFFRKKPDRTAVIAILIVFAGIVCCFGEGISHGAWLGDLAALASGVFYAGVFMLNTFEKGDAISSVFWGQLFCGATMSPLVVRETVFTPPVLAAVLCLGAFQVGVAYIFFTSGTRYTDPVTASVINALEPILNPILVMLFYGERLGRLSILGAAIVLCGILYYNLKKSRQK